MSEKNRCNCFYEPAKKRVTLELNGLNLEQAVAIGHSLEGFIKQELIRLGIAETFTDNMPPLNMKVH